MALRGWLFRGRRSNENDISVIIPEVKLMSNGFYKMKARGLMEDAFHYYQQGYNEVGSIAGKNAAASF